MNDINKETFLRALKVRETRKKLLILIVEDQRFSRILLKNCLTAHYDIIDVDNGEKALSEYTLHAPNIVFLDIELPGIDGHKVASLLRKLDSDAHIIMVTANNYLEDVQKAQNGGAKGFIAKPFNRQKIFECIKQYENKNQTG